MGDFKKFIETGGKSLEEIKKAINDMVNKVVDDVVDDVTEILPKDTRKQIKKTIRDSRKPDSSAQKIPPRDSTKAAAKSSTTPEFPQERGSGKKNAPLNLDDLDFSAEEAPRKTTPNFSYVTGRPVGEPPQLDHPNPIGYPHESIPENMNAQDEYMLHKIREMRSLEEITHNSYIVKQCAQITMVRQGEFMKDVEDDYGRQVFCAIPHPIYAALSNSQLRTYFSWRTDVRRGVYGDVEQPYVLLYCYELMNRIGVTSADDAFGRLIAVWENCRVNVKYADTIILRWIKDFYAFNDVTLPLPDKFTDTDKSNEDYRAMMEIEAGNFSGKLDYLAKNSAYNISESPFLDEKTRPMLDGACAAALGALAEYFKSRGLDIFSLLCGRMKKDFSWEPFQNAIVDIERMDGFRAVEISPMERYSVKRGEPVLERFECAVCRGFVGYVLKSVEAHLRKFTGFTRKLIPNIKMLENDIKNREKLEEAVSAPEFAEIIPRAVEQYCRRAGIAVVGKPKPKKAPKPWDEEVPAEPVVVNIDISKLDKIREQADENVRKLIVDELEYHEEVSQAPISAKAEEPALAETPDYEEIADKIGDDEFAESVAEYAELISEDENPAPNISAGNPIFENMEPEWQNLANNLTPENILFLGAMLDGTEREFCRERDILPQTMIEEINEEALRATDDVIIEGGAVLEDYAEQVRGLVNAFRR